MDTQLELFGASHRTAPIELLEGLALSPSEQDSFYREAATCLALQDVMVLSTCNRTEIYFTGATDDGAATAVRQILRNTVGNHRFPPDNHFYHKEGQSAVEHLCRVSCGLDSMILGEAQILGQVRAAYDASVKHHALSPTFDKAVAAALKVARKVRSQTDIGKGAVSVASAAVHLASRIYSHLSSQTVAVVGAGQTGRLLAEHFERHQPGRLLVLNRTFERAQELARQVGGEPLTLDDVPDVLRLADVLASSVQVAQPLIAKPMVEGALQQHRAGTLALLDLGLPRNIDPQVNTLHNVFLYDLDALKQVVDQNLGRRRKEVPRVEEQIEEELSLYAEWQRGQKAGPLIAALRQSVESMRQMEIDRLCSSLSDEERAKVDEVTRAVMNKLLHGPMTSIKKYSRGEDTQRLEVVQEVFHHLKLK